MAAGTDSLGNISGFYAGSYSQAGYPAQSVNPLYPTGSQVMGGYGLTNLAHTQSNILPITTPVSQQRHEPVRHLLDSPELVPRRLFSTPTCNNTWVDRQTEGYNTVDTSSLRSRFHRTLSDTHLPTNTGQPSGYNYGVSSTTHNPNPGPSTFTRRLSPLTNINTSNFQESKIKGGVVPPTQSLRDVMNTGVNDGLNITQKIPITTAIVPIDETHPSSPSSYLGTTEWQPANDLNNGSIVTVFGFPRDEASQIVSKLQKFGDILDYRLPNHISNWMDVYFVNTNSADLALTLNGRIFDNRYMLGVSKRKKLSSKDNGTIPSSDSFSIFSLKNRNRDSTSQSVLLQRPRRDSVCQKIMEYLFNF